MVARVGPSIVQRQELLCQFEFLAARSLTLASLRLFHCKISYLSSFPTVLPRLIQYCYSFMTLRHFDVAVNRFVTKMSYSLDFGALLKKTRKQGFVMIVKISKVVRGFEMCLLAKKLRFG